MDLPDRGHKTEIPIMIAGRTRRTVFVAGIVRLVFSLILWTTFFVGVNCLVLPSILDDVCACDWMLTPEEQVASIDDEVITKQGSHRWGRPSRWLLPRSVRGPSQWNSECHPSVTADGTLMVFNAGTQNGPPYDPRHIGDGFNLYCSHFDAKTQTWGQPEWLGPNVNASSYPTISADGQTLYFVHARSVYVSTWTGTEWSMMVAAPQPVNDDNPNSRDGPIALTPDGQTMFVASQRVGGYGQADIWQLTWNGSEWADPVNCGPGVNTESVETHPAISPDGARLYFSDFGGDRPGPDYGGVDLFYSDWTGSEWGEAQPVPAPVNTDLPLCSAHAAVDGRLFLGSEVSEGGYGEEDIWVTFENEAPPRQQLRGTREESWVNTGELPGAWYVYDLVESGNVIYAATAPSGRVFRTANGGLNWTPTAEIPNVSRTYSLLAASDGSIYAGTYPEGKVFRTTNDGLSWDELSLIPDATAVRCLAETSSGSILAATSPDSADAPLSVGRVFRLNTPEADWERLALLGNVASGIFSVYEHQPNLYFAGGRSYGDRLYVSPNGGTGWISVDLPYDNSHVTLAAIYFFYRDSNERLWTGGWAHGPQGILLSSTDNGVSWDTTGVIDNSPIIVGRVFDMVEADNGDLFIGVQPGPDRIVMRSSDGGGTWLPAGSLTGALEALCLLKTADGTIYAGTTRNGDVYRWQPEGSGVESVVPTPRLQVLASSPGDRAEIQYEVPKCGRCRISAHDVTGRWIATLLEQHQRRGEYTLSWNGRGLAAGVYFLRLEWGGQTVSAKLTLVR
jgi:hypothetical protein